MAASEPRPITRSMTKSACATRSIALGSTSQSRRVTSGGSDMIPSIQPEGSRCLHASPADPGSRRSLLGLGGQLEDPRRSRLALEVVGGLEPAELLEAAH